MDNGNTNGNMTYGIDPNKWQEFKELWDVAKPAQPQTIGNWYPLPTYPTHPCPSCGRCPTCGRGGYYYEQYPWYRPYPQTTWITCVASGS